MSRRASLPGAAELFRATGDTLDPATIDDSARRTDAANQAQAPGAVKHAPAGLDGGSPTSAGVRRTAPARRGAHPRQPTGRERHDEKITVYVSSDELYDLEQARLVLRGEHGLAVDRGRIVREAVSLVVADLEAKGDNSILVRRLRTTDR